MKITKFLLLAIVACQFAGCASKEVLVKKEDLNEPFDQIKDRMTATAPKGAAMAILSVTDGRTNRDNIGTAKTGMFNSEAPIQLYDSLENVFKDRIRANFEKKAIDTS